MLLQAQHIYVKFCYNMKTAKEMMWLPSEWKSESSTRLKKTQQHIRWEDYVHCSLTVKFLCIMSSLLGAKQCESMILTVPWHLQEAVKEITGLVLAHSSAPMHMVLSNQRCLAKNQTPVVSQPPNNPD
jgi:hypothetical protein